MMVICVICFSLIHQVCVYNGDIHRPVNQLPASHGHNPLLTARESCVEKLAALHHWCLHRQPKLLPGTMWVQTSLWMSLSPTDLMSNSSFLYDPCWYYLPVCSHSTVSWDNLRIPGVLQRLAWSYLVVACLDLLVARGHLDVYTMVSQQLIL